MVKKIVLFILLFLSLQSIQAQDGFFNRPVWSISVFNHSIGSKVKTPLNLGIAIGAEFTYVQNETSSWHQKVEIGWFNHKNLNTALFVKTDLVRRYTYNEGFFWDINLGAGYVYDTPANQPFELDDNGEFQKSSFSGRSNFITNLSLGSGYQINTKNDLTISPFIRYEARLQFPYSSIAPVFPQSLLHIGASIKL